jgi:hypothetical protein
MTNTNTDSANVNAAANVVTGEHVAPNGHRVHVTAISLDRGVVYYRSIKHGTRHAAHATPFYRMFTAVA